MLKYDLVKFLAKCNRLHHTIGLLIAFRKIVIIGLRKSIEISGSFQLRHKMNKPFSSEGNSGNQVLKMFYISFD